MEAANIIISPIYPHVMSVSAEELILKTSELKLTNFKPCAITARLNFIPLWSTFSLNVSLSYCVMSHCEKKDEYNSNSNIQRKTAHHWEPVTLNPGMTYRLNF